MIFLRFSFCGEVENAEVPVSLLLGSCCSSLEETSVCTCCLPNFDFLGLLAINISTK